MERLQETTISVFKICKNLIKTNKIVQSAIAITSVHIIRELGYYAYRKYNHLPPGPNGYPVFGCILDILISPRYFVDMVKKYGAVFWFPVMGTSMIFVGDVTIIKQLFHEKDFLDREDPKHEKQNKYKSLWSVGDDNTMPLVMISGEKWTKRRQHAQVMLFRTMTNKYVGDVLNDAIQNEVVPYLDNLIQQNMVWYPRELCQYLAFNTIFSTMFGKSIQFDSRLYNEMITDFDNTLKLSAKNELANSFPFLRLFKSIIDPIKFTRNRRNENVLQLIKERIKENESKNVKETYIDYTHQLVMDGEMTQNEEVADTWFLCMAAIDTTASTLDFGIILTAKYIDIQQKVRKELLSIMKNDKFDLKLAHNCPLFRAFIHEILRISSVAYIGVGHQSLTKDHWINVNGNQYKIPKKTTVRANVDYIHIYNKNDKNWKYIDGDKIFLDNFLSDDKTRFVMNESFIGFGVGRRDCVGRELAMQEIQYILGYLIMKYTMVLDQTIDDLLVYRKPNLVTVFMSPSIGVKIQKL